MKKMISNKPLYSFYSLLSWKLIKKHFGLLKVLASELRLGCRIAIAGGRIAFQTLKFEKNKYIGILKSNKQFVINDEKAVLNALKFIKIKNCSPVQYYNSYIEACEYRFMYLTNFSIKSAN